MTYYHINNKYIPRDELAFLAFALEAALFRDSSIMPANVDYTQKENRNILGSTEDTERKRNHAFQQY
jgi:hypothetical protein